MTSDLDQRKRRILKVVVQRFVLSGKPVGSKTVAKTSGLEVSTATIRNEMSSLEQLGLLEQPHTSAGRVPTDLAYRYYVDMLMGQPTKSEKDAEAVERLFEAKSRELEGFFADASMLLSSLTHGAGLVFAPYSPAETVRHVDLVHLSFTRVLLIVITGSGRVGRKLLILQSPVSIDTTERVARYIDEKLGGSRLEEMNAKDLAGGVRFGSAGSDLLKVAVDSMLEYMGEIDERVYIKGTANIVREMGDSGSEWVQLLLESMEKQYLVIDLLKDLIEDNRLTVRIGEENQLSALRKCTFVGTCYPLAPGLFGSLGVLGPTCMDYAKTIGTVELMAERMGRRLLSPAD